MESKLFGWSALPELRQAVGNARRATATRRRQALQMGSALAEIVAEDYSAAGRSDTESNARGAEVHRVIAQISDKLEEAHTLLGHLKAQIDAPLNAADEARVAQGPAGGPRLNI